MRAAPGGEPPPPPPPFEGTHPNDFKPPSGRAFPPDGPPPGGPPGILLMDAQHQAVVGMPGPGDPRDAVAIEVDGEVVGWLGIHSHMPFKSGRPDDLFDRQARQLYLLGGVVIGLTAIIAFLFSRSLLRPIRQLIKGTRELSRRNFTIRIDAAAGDEGYDRTIDSHVKNLRKKIAARLPDKEIILTLYGVGYKFFHQIFKPFGCLIEHRQRS